MALNITNLFTALGRVGKESYLIDTAEATFAAPFATLSGYSYLNPTWYAGLAQSYDPGIRTASGGMSSWQQAAQTILTSMVAAQSPPDGQTVQSSLAYLISAMTAGAQSVATCTTGASNVADSDNVGTGVCVVTTYRPDGLTQQNVIAEEARVTVTADSYTGGATAGQEPWQWQGSPNQSSLGTGAFVGLWDWDWPQGSGSVTAGQSISATQDATSNGNLLTNGDFETWTGSAPAVLDDWFLQTGTWGTSIARDASVFLGGLYSVKFNTAGSVLNALTQQFSSSITDGTDATAGTTAVIPPLSVLVLNYWVKAAGVVSGGVLTLQLVDSTNTVINDTQGNANTATLTLSTLTTSWVAHQVVFRTPAVLPTIVRLRIKVTTALAGAAFYMDDVCLCVPTLTYTAGPYVSVFSNPATPFEATPINDGFTVTVTNNRAGASYGATFQTLFARLFQQPATLIPYGGSPTQLDTLITS